MTETKPPRRSGSSKPTVEGISEIVLVVRDVRASASFYQDAVGLEPETPVSDEWAWLRMGPPERPQRLGLHRGSLLFDDQPAFSDRERWGPIHFAFHVPREQLASAAERVREHGVELYGPVRLSWMEADALYFYDPDGNLLELWSPDPAT